MKLGLIGPATSGALLAEAIEFLLGEAEVESVVYLGLDDAIEEVARAWAADACGGVWTEPDFIEKVATLAPGASVAQLDELLSIDAARTQLGRIRRVVKPPARAIELLGDRFVTLVWDKAVLAEEDIANSFIIAYGKSDQLFLKRFGPRVFFSPGPLDKNRLAILEDDDEEFVISIFSASGVPLSQESLGGFGATRVTVSP